MAVTIEESVGFRAFVGWAKEAPAGTEFADVRRTAEGIHAVGVALGTDPEPYRLDYVLTTDADLATTRLRLTTSGAGWSRTLDLRRTPPSGWDADVEVVGDAPFDAPGGDLAAVADAVDPDVELSPLFNTLPVLRQRLDDDGASVDAVLAWISVPDLAVRPSRQRYTFLGKAPEGRVFRFDTLDGDFTAEIVLDEDGLVVDYPGVASRILTDAQRRDR